VQRRWPKRRVESGDERTRCRWIWKQPLNAIVRTYGRRGHHPLPPIIATTEGQKLVLDAAGDIDILVHNAGGPPPGHVEHLGTREDFHQRRSTRNMLAPSRLIKAAGLAMMRPWAGAVLSITLPRQSVRAPIVILGLSNSPVPVLTLCRGYLLRQGRGKGFTINNLLAGIHATTAPMALDGGSSNKRDHLKRHRTERASTNSPQALRHTS